jgi:DNA helicase-2/ATP-dependent DNA helicase PcrA
MISAEQLTAEQRAVVHHEGGPAVVLAVPGAGKTTAVVHRLRTLVEDRGVAPDRLLATSFNRATVEDLSTALGALGLQDIETRTLHGLGHMVLRAADAPLVQNRAGDAPSPDACAYRLAHRALRDHADAQGLHPADLDVTASDLVDQVAAWKQQLAYVDPDRASLPEGARSLVRPAQHEHEAYVALYRRFEAHREQEGWLTYPDMLREAWERLARNAALRGRLQARYAHLVVDEFQDVGRAQFYILDYLTAPDRNYLVVGDDDQCIYGWRGASPSFLLDFADRYDAEEYRMQESFRLPAAPLVLARTAIPHNETRRPKTLRLTQGLGGPTELLRRDDAEGVAKAIATRAERLRAGTDYTLADLVVLVRTYGQTPPIEQALVDRGVPYRVRGEAPFYRRRPVQTLLRYLYAATLERRRRDGGFDRPHVAERYVDRVTSIINRPNRYVERARIEYTARRARKTGRSILSMLSDQQPDMPDDTADRVGMFVSIMEGLVDRLDAPAADTLSGLVERLDFEAVLRERSATATRGEMRVRTVRALLRFAADHDNTLALLRAVQSLADAPSTPPDTPVLELRSIHRAKGAEWPVVFLPGCTDGTLPLESEAGEAADIEEERRLFYVALTRARDHLFLGSHADAPDSPFLDDADAPAQIEACTRLRETLQRPPDDLSDEACARLCHDIADLQLRRYVRRWWRPDTPYAAALRDRLRALEPRIEKAEARLAAYEEETAEYETALSRLPDTVDEEVSSLRDRLGETTLTASLPAPDASLPPDAALTFAPADDHIRVRWHDEVVARIDPFSAALDASALLALPWADLVARPISVRSGAGTLRFRFDWAATADRMLDAERAALSPPTDPDATTRLLAGDRFKQGYTCLRRRLETRLDAAGT